LPRTHRVSPRSSVGRSPEEHAHTIEAMRGYARIRDTDELIEELKAFTPARAAG
jgi:hypothetical protein